MKNRGKMKKIGNYILAITTAISFNCAADEESNVIASDSQMHFNQYFGSSSLSVGNDNFKGWTHGFSAEYEVKSSDVIYSSFCVNYSASKLSPSASKIIGLTAEDGAIENSLKKLSSQESNYDCIDFESKICCVIDEYMRNDHLSDFTGEASVFVGYTRLSSSVDTQNFYQNKLKLKNAYYGVEIEATKILTTDLLLSVNSRASYSIDGYARAKSKDQSSEYTKISRRSNMSIGTGVIYQLEKGIKIGVGSRFEKNTTEFSSEKFKTHRFSSAICDLKLEIQF